MKRKTTATKPAEQTELPFEETAQSNVGVLLSRLEFSPDNVIPEASSQALLFMKAAEFHMEALRGKNKAKAAYEREKARISLRIRERAREEGERITEGNLAEKMLFKKTLNVFGRALTEAEELFEYSKLLLEAYRMRRDSLRVVEGATSSEKGMQRFLEESNQELSKTRKKLESKYS